MTSWMQSRLLLGSDQSVAGALSTLSNSQAVMRRDSGTSMTLHFWAVMNTLRPYQSFAGESAASRGIELPHL